MKTKLLLIGLTSLFLSGCVNSTRLVKTEAYVEALTQPTEIEGPVKTRGDAEKNGDLWEFAGQAEDAVNSCNLDKTRLKKAVKDGPC